MRNIYLPLLAIICFFSFIIDANAIGSYPGITAKSQLGKNYFARQDSLSIDTTYVLQRNANGLITIPREWFDLEPGTTFRDTMFYNPSFLPVVFDGLIVPSDIDFRSKKFTDSSVKLHLIDPNNTLLPYIKRSKMIQEHRREYYLDLINIEKIKYSTLAFSANPLSKQGDVTKKNFFKDLITTEDPIGFTSPGIEKFVPDPVYWLRTGEHSLQVAQNYISDNWHKGGNPNYFVRSFHKLDVNYKKDKVTFNSTLEWRLGLQNTVGGDTLRNVNVNDDFLRLYNVLGYKAFNHWSYSATLDTRTQVLNIYPENSMKRKASFLAPVYMNPGIGMSYNLDKKFENSITKRLKISLDLSPFSADFRYVRDDKVDPTLFGIDAGRKSNLDFGSRINTNVEFVFNSFVRWNADAFYFTNYERVECEVQNRVNMNLSKYLSTTFNLIVRFDDNVPVSKRDNTLGYFQINQLLSFGLNYKW